jgi:glutathione S-transferase
MSLQQPPKPIELISFNLCPFVQRSVITLLKKGIDFKITYIDLADKPDWFLKISPLGKVPVVRYGEDVLFESAVINEFLDEISPSTIMPTDSLQKAKDRGWIEYSSQVIMSQYLATVAGDQAEYEKQADALDKQLARLENMINHDEFFGGPAFSLVDSSIAPLFTRFEILKNHYDLDFLKDYPKLTKLGEKYLQLDYVKQSVVEDFEPIFIEYLGKRNSLLAA